MPSASKIDAARQKAVEAQRELQALLDSLDTPEPKGPRAVVEFTVTWGGKNVYTYVALRAKANWYITGNKTGAYSWQDILDLADAGSISTLRH